MCQPKVRPYRADLFFLPGEIRLIRIHHFLTIPEPPFFILEGMDQPSLQAPMHQLSHLVRRFNRFELKYMPSLQAAEEIKKTLCRYLVPDEHGHGRYGLTSLYYDSPDLRCYQEKVDGLRVRRKLRIRYYESEAVFSEATPVFVEIKQRVDRVTQKRRAILPYAQALRLCNDRQIPAHEAEDRAVIEEIYVFLWQYNLLPTSIVHYERQAFIGTEYDLGLRVTFDTSLTFQVHPLHLHEQTSSLPMLPTDRVVMEIKINERMPTWLTGLIRAHALQTVRVSKYCCSIESAREMPAFLSRSLAAESSQEVLLSSPAVFSTVEKKMGIPRH